MEMHFTGNGYFNRYKPVIGIYFKFAVAKNNILKTVSIIPSRILRSKMIIYKYAVKLIC